MKSKHPMAFCRFNRIIAAVILPALFFAAPMWAQANFSDVDAAYWGAPYIEAAASAGIIDGYAVGTTGTYIFKPESMVSKQESVTMLYRTLSKAGRLKEDTDLSIDYAQSLKDSNIDSWASRYAAYGFKYSILTQADFAATTKTLKGGAVNAPRQLVAAWCSKAMEYELSPISVLPYQDAANVSADMIPYVDALYRNGIMTGDTKGNLNPQDGIKRVEFATVCTRLLAYAQGIGDATQVARKLADSLIVMSGTVMDINLDTRTLVIKDVD